VVYSVVSVLKYYSNSDDLHQFVVWGLGSFSDLAWSQLAFFSCVVALALMLSFLLSKSLNLMLLGDQYAQSLGLNIKRTRLSIVLLTGILASVITAFCGPIAFIGFAVPHLTKTLLRTSNHLLLVPAVALSGSLLALICNLLARLPYGFDGALPINAVTSLFGAPIVLWMVLSKRKA
jgi:iron complex transport system permease protein